MNLSLIIVNDIVKCLFLFIFLQEKLLSRSLQRGEDLQFDQVGDI